MSLAKERSSQDHWKGQASEILAIYPLVRHFAQTEVARNGMEDPLDSLMVLCEILDLLKAASRQPTAEQMEQIANDMEFAISVHHQAFLLAYGSDAIRPKHHQLMHLPSQLKADKAVLSCWVNERKHAMARRCLAHADRKTSFEAGALARMLNEQLRQLEAATWALHLQGNTQDFPEQALSLMRWQETMSFSMATSS